MEIKLKQEFGINKQYRLGLGRWEVNCLDNALNMEQDFIDQGKKYLTQWQAAWEKVHPNEETWIRKEHGLPSLLIRFDATETENGTLSPYEIEARPAGVGLALKLHSQFGERLQRVANSWPDYKVVLSERRSAGGTDDSIWRDVVDLPTAIQNEFLVLVRADPDEREFYGLSSRSVAPVITEADKRYGVEMGLWKEVSSRDQLPRDHVYVLKPKIGSQARGVMMVTPEVDQEQMIRAAFDANTNGLYVQKYHPPMNSGLFNYPNMIYRIFYGYNLLSEEWEFLGGFWNASPHLIVDGGKDTIYGPIIKNY